MKSGSSTVPWSFIALEVLVAWPLALVSPVIVFVYKCSAAGLRHALARLTTKKVG